MLSRISGLARDVLVARAFGAGPITDAFWVAFRIPNLLRRLFAEGAFAQAFVPILGAARNNRSDDEVRTLLDRVALLLTLALMLVTLVGIVAAPWVVSAMASGLRGAARDAEFGAAVWMTRVMFPYILCMSLIAFASGVLNTWRRFAVPAFTPVLLNLSMIAACLWLAPRMDVPIYGLAIGVMAGGVAQLAVQWVALARLGLTPRFSLRVREAWADATVQRILKQMAPATLGVSVAQISLLINTNIATWLTPGSVTWLSFADRLMEFPTALLGVALSTVLLPSLSAANARDDHAGYSALLDWGLRLVLLLGLPAAVGMALLSDGLVATLFHYGAFAAQDVAQTRVAVMSYSAGLIGLLAVKILAGLLRQAGHPHPGQDRHRRTDRDPVAEPGAGAAAGPRRPGPGHRPGRLPGCAGPAHPGCCGAASTARARLDPVRAAAAAGAGRAGGAAGLCRWPHRLDRAAGSCRPAGGLAGAACWPPAA